MTSNHVTLTCQPFWTRNNHVDDAESVTQAYRPSGNHQMNIPQTVASVCLEVYGSYLENDCKSSSYTDLETGQ